jgi:drug/metabolite transporter (DMT)-like permease
LLVVGAGAFFASAAATAFAAINMTRLLDVTLIGALQPVVIIALAVLFLGERVDRGYVGRASIAVAGTVLVAAAASGSGTWTLAGELMAVLSLFLNVGWYLYGRVLRDRYPVDPFGLMLGVLTTAALIMTPVALVAHGSLAMPRAAIGYAFLTMLVGTSAHLLLVWAHRYVPASVSAPLLLAEPVLVAAGAWVFFGETLGALEIAGALVVLCVLRGMVRAAALTNVDEETADPAPPA